MACSLIPSGLQLQSIAGNSGKAFKGQRSDGTPVFVKYEMPPIVSVLAREQITPPILSANREAGMGHRVEQEWLNGGGRWNVKIWEVNRCVRFWCACTILVFC